MHSAHIVLLQLAVDDRSLGVDDREAGEVLIGLQLQREQREQAVALGCCLLQQSVHPVYNAPFGIFSSCSRGRGINAGAGIQRQKPQLSRKGSTLPMQRVDVQDNANIALGRTASAPSCR